MGRLSHVNGPAQPGRDTRADIDTHQRTKPGPPDDERKPCHVITISIVYKCLKCQAKKLSNMTFSIELINSNHMVNNAFWNLGCGLIALYKYIR